MCGHKKQTALTDWPLGNEVVTVWWPSHLHDGSSNTRYDFILRRDPFLHFRTFRQLYFLLQFYFVFLLYFQPKLDCWPPGRGRVSVVSIPTEGSRQPQPNPNPKPQTGATCHSHVEQPPPQKCPRNMDYGPMLQSTSFSSSLKCQLRASERHWKHNMAHIVCQPWPGQLSWYPTLLVESQQTIWGTVTPR